MNIFDYMIPIALGAVLLVLLMGLANMMRGGSSSLSQKLMRWRVALQFLAVIIVMASLYYGSGW
jgi:hypoxia induced protein